jgi:hypothetical protein
MSSDKTYVIDLESSDFDAYLCILNSAGKKLAKDYDSGGNHNDRHRMDTFGTVCAHLGSM